MSIFTTLLTTVILVFGLALTPYLLVEEKEAHTLEALKTSPAHYSQINIAKAITGIFYCVIATIILFLLNYHLVVHWDITILWLILGSVVAVGIGLVAGVNVENPASLNLWMGVLVIFLMIPTFMELIQPSRMPDLLRTILPWIPSVATVRLFQIAMVGDITGSDRRKPRHPGCFLFGFNIFLYWRVRKIEM